MGRNNNRTIALVALLLGVVGLSVGFAALSSTLSINGSATVQASSWNVFFSSLSTGTKTGTANIVTAPSIASNKLSITGFDVTVKTPKDSVYWTFNVENSGSYIAKLSSITKNATPTCTGTGTNATTDAANVCKYLKYQLIDTTAGTSEAATGVTIAAKGTSNGTRSYKLILTYDSAGAATASELPTNPVTISGLNIAMKFVQA